MSEQERKEAIEQLDRLIRECEIAKLLIQNAEMKPCISGTSPYDFVIGNFAVKELGSWVDKWNQPPITSWNQ